MWRGKLITVSEPLLKKRPVTTHCQGAMRGPSALKDGWCCGRAVFLSLQMSPTQTDQPDDGSGWHRKGRPSNRRPSLCRLCCVFNPLQSKCPSHLCQAHQGDISRKEQVQRQRHSSCSAFTYWPITAGAINWSRVESCTSGPWSSPDIQITQHLTLCVAYGRNKWNLLT